MSIKFITKIVLSLILVNLILFTTFIFLYSTTSIQTDLDISITGKENFSEAQYILLNIAKKKGALSAYQTLISTKFDPKVNTHVLGHAVGEEMYKQMGLSGMKYCTPDIQNACSHAIVIGYLLERGENGIHDIKSICKTAPGQPSAYLQCFHGLGHALMAYSGYNIEKTINLCEKAGGKAEELACAGGAVMEIVNGGLHDPNLWEKMRGRYLSRSNPLSPCNTEFIPQKTKSICYSYLTPYLLNFYQPLIIANDENIQKSFELCDRISKIDLDNRDSCFGGFGKEFVVFAEEDLKNPNDATKQVYQWCTLAGNKDGEISCIKSAINSYYWGGVNSYDNALLFCNQINENESRNACFDKLISSVYQFETDKKNITDFCNNLPNSFRKACLN